ncbi:MAG: hypothetical protein IJ678_01775 [Kiritimatiellae bacterium]|nr:hypothetical protein [Kiritimatiellia bacterium]
MKTASLFAIPLLAAAATAAAGSLEGIEKDNWDTRIRRIGEEMAARDAAALPKSEAWTAEAPATRMAAKGIEADSETRTVRISAFTTDIAPGAIAEFALVTLNSGHEYEAVFQTAATATDIENALRFAGIPAGKPADRASFRFWPRGERVFATVSLDGAPARPLEDFLADAATGVPFAAEGFVHVGGAPGEGGTNAVDIAGPGSIVPSYNEPVSLFDVPRLAAQSDVYESVVASSAVAGRAFVPARIEFSAEKRPAPLAPLRVKDVSLEVLADGSLLLDGATNSPAAAVAALREMRGPSALDPYVSFSWEGAAPLSLVRKAAALLEMLEAPETGVRVDAPPAGFPYYRAFLPQERWRDRAERFSQPCELRFDAAGAATLVAIAEHWKDDELKPELEIENFAVESPEALPGMLAAHAPPDLRVLLVFAPGSLQWSAVAPYLAAARPTHALVQIFLD